MNTLTKYLGFAGIAAMILSGPDLLAQQGGGQGGGNRGNRGGGNFDPAEFRQRMMDRYKEMLEITDDTEWKAIEPLVTKVNETRMAAMGGGMGRAMFGRNRPGGPGGDAAGGGGGQGQRRMGGEPNPETEALQKAIDAKASKTELQAALQKYVAARKAKQADLEAAQAKLRAVLTPRQEAIATLNGLL